MPDLTLQDSTFRYDFARADRTNFDTLWQMLADLILPTREFIRTDLTQGERKRLRIFDSTAPDMAEQLPAAIHFLLTNPSDRWVQLQLEDLQGFDDPDATSWLYDATNRLLMFLALPQAGFAQASHEVYQDEVVFGNAGCQANAIRPGSFKFTARALAGMHWLEDMNGEITDVFRTTKERVRDLMVEFGDRVPDSLRPKDPSSKIQAGEDKVLLVHHVWLRRERDPRSASNLNMPWGSRHFLTTGTNDKDQSELSFGGFRENPYITPRWSKAAEETYGRGPADKALPDIQSINAMSRDQLVAGAMRTRPPVNVWDASMKSRKLELFPGGVNRMKAGIPAAFAPTAMITGADPDAAEQSIQRKARAIRAMFFSDLLELPLIDKSHSAMTEGEAQIRRQTAIAKASPIVSRFTAEWLVPAVGKTFRWMLGRGLFLPIPPSMAGKPVQAVFTGPMAQSQRARESQLVLEGIQAGAVIASADPRVWMNLDADMAFRTVWNQTGADPRLMRQLSVVRKMREQDDAQRELQAQAGLAKDFAKAGADASKLLTAGAA